MGLGSPDGSSSVAVDHVTVYRWVQRFTPLFADAAVRSGTRPVIGGSSTRPASRSPAGGGTCTGGGPVRAGHRRAAVRAAGHRGSQPVLRQGTPQWRCAGRSHDRQGGRLPTSPRRPGAGGRTRDRPVHQQPDRSRPRPAEGSAATDAWPKRLRSAAVVAVGHAFLQNLSRGHYELGTEAPPPLRVATDFAELALSPDRKPLPAEASPRPARCNSADESHPASRTSRHRQRIEPRSARRSRGGHDSSRHPHLPAGGCV